MHALMAACPLVSVSSSSLRRKPIVIGQRRISANRRNAARSTEPCPPEEKARAARTAIKPGFFVAPYRWIPERRCDFQSTYPALDTAERRRNDHWLWTMLPSRLNEVETLQPG
jgi:hypothetical protein